MVENLGIDGLFSIKGKTALVTGGSSGLGLMMAKGLLRNGARVVITSRSQQKLDKARRELDSHGEVFSYAADVTDAANRKNLLNFVFSFGIRCVVQRSDRRKKHNDNKNMNITG